MTDQDLQGRLQDLADRLDVGGQVTRPAQLRPQVGGPDPAVTTPGWTERVARIVRRVLPGRKTCDRCDYSMRAIGDGDTHETRRSIGPVVNNLFTTIESPCGGTFRRKA